MIFQSFASLFYIPYMKIRSKIVNPDTTISRTSGIIHLADDLSDEKNINILYFLIDLFDVRIIDRNIHGHNVTDT